MSKETNGTWPVVAIICAVIVSVGIYLGVKDNAAPHSVPPASNRSDAITTDGAKVPKEAIVYGTRTGSCYHRGSCSYLKSSRIPMSLSEAKRQYRPCSRCGPPR